MDAVSNKKIWVIGASSGIGAALTTELSRRGARLVISARRKDDLERLAQTLEPKPEVIALDVSDAGALKKAAKACGRLDSVIFLAAVYKPGLVEKMSLEDAHQTVDININGALNTIAAVYPDMKQRGDGQIVLCGSVAAYSGLPNSQPYSLTKAALMNLAQTLKTEAECYHVDVKLISPGFVKTLLTDKNDFTMPMMIDADAAAGIIADGLVRQDFEIHFPKRFTRMVKLLSMLPYSLFFRITRDMLDKLTRKDG